MSISKDSDCRIHRMGIKPYEEFARLAKLYRDQMHEWNTQVDLFHITDAWAVKPRDPNGFDNYSDYHKSAYMDFRFASKTEVFVTKDGRLDTRRMHESWGEPIEHYLAEKARIDRLREEAANWTEPTVLDVINDCVVQYARGEHDLSIQRYTLRFPTELSKSINPNAQPEVVDEFFSKITIRMNRFLERLHVRFDGKFFYHDNLALSLDDMLKEVKLPKERTYIK